MRASWVLQKLPKYQLPKCKLFMQNSVDLYHQTVYISLVVDVASIVQSVKGFWPVELSDKKRDCNFKRKNLKFMSTKFEINETKGFDDL